MATAEHVCPECGMARTLGINSGSCRRLVHTGKLPAVRYGRTQVILIDRDILRQFAANYDRRPGGKEKVGLW